jgi:glycosyltransferase involved in cell wall biosynthesis
VPDAADFLYIGMMRDLKGPDVFFDAFARTERALQRPLSAVMVGDGPDRDRYRDRITQLGLGRRIRMLDAMPATEAFALARTVVVPSRAEAMPYIVLEVLSAEKPLIATRVGGIPEVMGDDSAALAAPDDAADLAARMVEAMTQGDWQERVMPKPRAFREKFAASVMAGEMMALYRELTARR